MPGTPPPEPTLTGGRLRFARNVVHEAPSRGIRRGRIRSSVRIWTRPQVKVGGRYRMDEGHIVVDSISPIAFDAICCAHPHREWSCVSVPADRAQTAPRLLRTVAAGLTASTKTTMHSKPQTADREVRQAAVKS